MTARTRVDGAGLVEVHDRTAHVGDGGFRLETDLRVPGTTLGRHVLHAPADARWTSPHPHVHDYPHDFVCVRGRCLVACGRDGEEPRHSSLATGDRLHVPSMTAHQLALEPGSIVASYIPHVTWLLRPEEVVLSGEGWVGCG